MRILLIEEFDSAPVPQALQCENIAFDMVPPPEEDEPFVFPEGVYDAAILTTSDLSYGRSVKTCARLSLIREEGTQIPILIVLPHPSARDRARLLDAGADYVLAEPFVSDELAAVLRALARRSPAIKSEILTAGDLTFDRGRCTVKSRSGEIRLSGKETLLIDIFLSNPGQVVSRETIQARVWGSDSQSTYNSLRIEQAARLLRETDLPVMEVGFSVGFDNFSYFIKRFRSVYGVSPSHYRKG